jgi:hypothetical protein
MRIFGITASFLAMLALAGCASLVDDRTQRRIATGALIGATASVITDGNPVKGAIVGGVVGGITSKSQLDWDAPLP